MSGPVGKVLWSAATLAFGGGAVCAPAAAQERFTVDVAAGAGVATNPFLRADSAETSPSLTVQITPVYVVDMSLTQIRVRGDVALTQYLRDYGTNDSYSLDATVTRRLNERSQLSGRAGYINSVIGGFNDAGVIGRGVILPGVTPGFDLPTGTPDSGAVGFIDPSDDLLPGIITDPSLGGLGERRQSYQAGIGFQSMMSPRDRIDLDLSGTANRYGGQGVNEFNYLAQRTGYTRILDEGTELSANILVGRSDYLGTRIDDATIIQPGVAFFKRLASGLRLGVSAGVSIVRQNDITGTQTSTGASGSIDLCRQDTRWNACLSGSRSVVPSAAQGVRPQTAVSASGGYRLSPRDTFSLRASFSHVGNALDDLSTTGVATRSTDFLSVKGDYRRIISPRLSAFVSAGVARAYDDLASRRANVEARAGLSYRFGANR